jgi:hypothetical protein
MPERRGAVVTWAAGISAAAAAFAGMAASRPAPLLRNAWFIGWLIVALVFFLLLLAVGLPDLVGWLRENKGRPDLPADRVAAELGKPPAATADHPDVPVTEAEYETMTTASSSEPLRPDPIQAGLVEKLERMVADRYQSPAAIERLIANSGINTQLLDTSGAVLVVAHRGLQLVINLGRLPDLIGAMRRDYPDDPMLKSLRGLP